MSNITHEMFFRKVLVIALCLKFLLTTSLAGAAELYAKADVLSSEPIIEVEQSRQQLDGCPGSKPAGRNILELMDWDLQSGNCLVTRETEVISGYLVRYQWDEQIFSQVMPEPPGRTVPVYIKIH